MNLTSTKYSYIWRLRCFKRTNGTFGVTALEFEQAGPSALTQNYVAGNGSHFIEVNLKTRRGALAQMVKFLKSKNLIKV